VDGISDFITRIREWYRGKKVPAGPGVYSHGLLIFQRERYEQPPLAKALKAIWRFLHDHWGLLLTGVVVPVAIAVWLSS
jgi:hypothetical protein